ncbi:MAG: molybdenum cofactor biosynthesis protein MoaE [Limisphaerales bacterium]
MPTAPESLREIGACVEFHGIVRETENGKTIPALFYEAYEAMAKSQLERIIAELNAAHPCEEIFFRSPAGESSCRRNFFVFARVVAASAGGVSIRVGAHHAHEGECADLESVSARFSINCAMMLTAISARSWIVS